MNLNYHKKNLLRQTIAPKLLRVCNQDFKFFLFLQSRAYSGTGKPKPLSYGKTGQWSRRITAKHRLVYSVDDEKITVLMITASGHYDD
jgi:Txe/YoeB family toxin of toxin-antitoxin system